MSYRWPLVYLTVIASMAGEMAPGREINSTYRRFNEPYRNGARKRKTEATGGRSKSRILYSFEDSKTFEIDGKTIPYLSRFAEGIDLAYVMDNGVTHGRWCARATIPAGRRWATIQIKDKETLTGWEDYDYFAVDVYSEHAHPSPLIFELQDNESRNYQTRCSFDNARIRKGKQTLMWPINRAKRNNKEGRSWNELEPKDKINMRDLKLVKLFTNAEKGKRLQLWLDNFRLLQEDAAKPKMSLQLPKNAIAFDFGSPGACVPGFTPVSPEQIQGNADPGGKGWPDPLSGTFVSSRRGVYHWSAKVPSGTYHFWLCAGMILPERFRSHRYLLKLNNSTIKDVKPSAAEYNSTDYLYRFLWTQYSSTPHANWFNYIDRMYPVHQGTLSVTNGQISLQAENFFVSALILMPQTERDDFERMHARITKARIDLFERLCPPPKKATVSGKGFTVFSPRFTEELSPDSPAGKSLTSVSASGAQGQNVFIRIGVRANEDLGRCTLNLSALTGPETIPNSAIEIYFKNHRWHMMGTKEMQLLPTGTFSGEAGITQSLWAWIAVPSTAKPGVYKGSLTVKTQRAGGKTIPVQLRVYPFALREDAPISYGMYGGGTGRWDGQAKQRIHTARYKWMKKIGLTGTHLPVHCQVVSVNAETGKVEMLFDKRKLAALQAAGLGQHAKQYQMTTQLGLARAIARKLLPAKDKTGSPVDKDPGCEFNHPAFKKCWMNAMKQVKAFLDSVQVPYAIEVVDEPREVPNPWNRNLADTLRYADWMGELGFNTRFITPMADSSGGKPYTGIAQHCDIVSIHSSAGSKGHERASRNSKRQLWYYNTSYDRFSWGFYPWARDVTGRWEWHWRWKTADVMGGYPGEDASTPFTKDYSYTVPAPERNGLAFLFKTKMLRIAEGCTDRKYIHTLETLLKSRPKHASASEAKALLAQIRQTVPRYPHKADYDKAAQNADQWRSRIAELIMRLQK